MKLELAVSHDLSRKARLWIEKNLELYLGPRKPKLYISELVIDGLTLKGDFMAFQLRSDGSAHARVSAKDAKGNPATIQDPVWSVSDPALLSVTADEDGLGATVTPVGPTGTAQVQFSCDADLGEGVRTLTGQADVEVIAGEAAIVEITFDAQPTPTPEPEA